MQGHQRDFSRPLKNGGGCETESLTLGSIWFRVCSTELNVCVPPAAEIVNIGRALVSLYTQGIANGCGCEWDWLLHFEVSFLSIQRGLSIREQSSLITVALYTPNAFYSNRRFPLCDGTTSVQAKYKLCKCLSHSLTSHRLRTSSNVSRKNFVAR